MRPVHVVVWLPLAPAAIISFFTSSFLLIVYMILASHIIKPLYKEMVFWNKDCVVTNRQQHEKYKIINS